MFLFLFRSGVGLVVSDCVWVFFRREKLGVSARRLVCVVFFLFGSFLIDFCSCERDFFFGICAKVIMKYFLCFDVLINVLWAL